MSDARTEIFNSVRSALKSSGVPAPAPLTFDPAVVRQIDPQTNDERWAMFVERLAALGDTAERFDSLAALRTWLLAELQTQNYTGGAIDADAAEVLDLDIPLADSLDTAALLRAQFAISLADLAVAETGSLAIAAGLRRNRLTSLAPEVHYVILPFAKLHSDLVEGLAAQRADFAHVSALWWVTGSSRTADIEGILIRGAHGPKRLVVLSYEA